MEQWLLYLSANLRYSKNTIENYRRDITQLCRMLELEDLDIKDLNSELARKFISKKYSLGLGARGLGRMISSWKNFYRWYSLQIQTNLTPLNDIKTPKPTKELPKSISVDQMKSLLDGNLDKIKIKNADPIIIRDQAILELFYSSGLRLSELISTDLQYTKNKNYTSKSWLYMDRAEIIVLGKGNKQRILPIGKTALFSLKKWIEVRDKFISNKTREEDIPALFLGIKGQRISPRVIQIQLKKISLNMNIPGSISPHAIRHSFASHLLQSSQDLRAVQELLGHKSITTTQIYTKLDFQHLSSIYDKTHPRAKKS
ncbi:tyrosine recombinase XerC [Candidatus Kinetoplastidibacterium crithidiae]|uniref:tyrosine recombinase XerC n=1 Tax=Candidatus Kinetoplastidibacterium crithidiae TaxID=33056 RepID=UPI00059FF848|nr:tyrosine recombinase XerC [Candidatus Kinetoplastibacterium crithidii]